jgi:Putative DNA-binding domain
MQLKTTQRWLQLAIVSPREPSATGRHIAASATLTPIERIGIYRDLYPARLVAALKLDYPLLCQSLGGEVFSQLALFYAQARPSHSFTLNEFGRHLPEFLMEVQGLRRPGFLRDLAQFERACSDVFHEAEARAVTPEAIAEVPAAAWHRARLQPIPALRLLALEYPVHRYAEGETLIRKRPAFVAIYRRNFEVQWISLSRASFSVLTLLVQGQPIGRALNDARGSVQQWFRDWMAAGLFQAVKLR